MPVTWFGPEETDAKRMCLFRASVLTVWGKTVTPTNNDKTVTAVLCQLTYSKGSVFFSGRPENAMEAAEGGARKDWSMSVSWW